MNLPVTITWFPRSVAEQKYGFHLYQGGAAPVKELRVVNIEGFDVELCGGTHVKTTGEVGLIKIIKSERVQDGVERLEYVAGEVAVNYVEKQESILLESSAKLETPAEKLSALHFQHESRHRNCEEECEAAREETRRTYDNRSTKIESRRRRCEPLLFGVWRRDSILSIT